MGRATYYSFYGKGFSVEGQVRANAECDLYMVAEYGFGRLRQLYR